MSWTPLQLVALGALGLLAGAMNAAAGGGSLLTFPALVAFGLPALTANLSNSVAQCPGYVSISYGYRPELAGQRARILGLLPAALVGGVAGVALLELGSPATFKAVAPVLVIVACLLLAAPARLRSGLARRAGHRHRAAGLHVAVGGTCAYAAYFGAGGGVLLLAVLSTFVADELQRLNALNRLLIMIVNLMAAVLFIILGPLNWPAIAVLGPTTLVGGRGGVALVRRLEAETLRAVVLFIGVVSAVYLAVTSW